MNRPKIYIAGPMRGRPQFNFPAFDAAEKFLAAQGFTPISPAAMDRLYEGWNPHPPADLAVDTDLKVRCMSRDLAVIFTLRPENGDCLYLLDGWKDSAGARVELSLAKFLCLPVVFQGTWGLTPGGKV